MYSYCDWTSQIIKDSECADCPVCEKPSIDKTICVKDSTYETCFNDACDWATEYIVKGKCTKCAACHTSNFNRV